MNDLSHAHPLAGHTSDAADRPRLDVVADMDNLHRLKAEWDALLAQDPDAGVFMSHDWLAPAFQAHPGRWRVFVLRDDGDLPLCILPVKYRVHWSQSKAEFQTEIEAGGRLAWGEYTGFVCRMDQEAQAVQGMAECLRGFPWKGFSLRYEPTERRSQIFAEALGEGFEHEFRPYRINKSTVDNLVGLQVPLRGDFDTLLSERLSANTRQKIRRFRRKLLDSGTYRIQIATPETVERDIANLLQHWLAKWDDGKSTKDMVTVAERYGRALLTAEATGALYLPSLWQGEKMLGALGHVIDWRRGIAHFLVAGRDPTAPDPAIGLLLHAQAIEWAIARNLVGYDLGHGDQPYKISFGPDTKRSSYLTVRRTGDGPVLDPICLQPALSRLARYAKSGNAARVEKGASQLAALLGG